MELLSFLRRMRMRPRLTTPDVRVHDEDINRTEGNTMIHTLDEITEAVGNRNFVRVTNRDVIREGLIGVALEYDGQQHTVKVGTIDRHGVYSGQSVKVSVDAVQIIPARPGISPARVRNLAQAVRINNVTLLVIVALCLILDASRWGLLLGVTITAAAGLHASWHLFKLARK